jgi:hypothetical protein
MNKQQKTYGVYNSIKFNTAEGCVEISPSSQHTFHRKRTQNQEEIASSACYLLRAAFLLGLFFGPEDGGDMFLRKVLWLIFDGLHGVISQKPELFITTAARASNPTDTKRCPLGPGLVTADYKFV